jgi:hypothetical protein
MFPFGPGIVVVPSPPDPERLRICMQWGREVELRTSSETELILLDTFSVSSRHRGSSSSERGLMWVCSYTHMVFYARV